MVLTIFRTIRDYIYRRLFISQIKKTDGHVQGPIYYYSSGQISIGRRCEFFSGCLPIKITNYGVVKIGDDFSFQGSGIDSMAFSQIFVSKDAVLSIGNYSGCSQTSIHCFKQITIGNYVNFGAGCLIMDTDFHSTDWKLKEDRAKDYDNAKTASVTIEDYAFIGARCIITKGVHIGKRSIVAAGSVVVSDIPDDCLAGGNPCKVIKKLTK